MSATPPPGYTPPPTDLPQRGDRATFSNRVDAWVTWFSTVILTQLAAMIANAYANAVDAAASATAAMGYRDTALTYRDAAQAARDAAQGYRDTAMTYRDQAAASAAASAASAVALTATSATDGTIATGTLNLVTQSGKQFATGVNITAVDQANAANAVYGKVVSYSGTNLQINVTSYEGSGAVSAWNISVGGQRGAPGPAGGIAGGNLTGALNENKSADLASAATIDPWSGVGNYQVLTGAVQITGVAAAPRAGARRRLLAAGASSLTASANIVIKGVLTGQSITFNPGDEIDFYAETTTKFRVTVTKADGSATAAFFGAFQNAVLLTGTGTFTAKRTGWHRITLAGSGGRGGFVLSNSSTKRATGGGSAGFCVGMRFLIAGQTYNYVQAAGAPDGTLSANGTTLAGVAGSASTFFGSGIATLLANGGNGGLASLVAAALAGGTGGTASGGDVNVIGATAGAVLGTAAGSAATGGAAVGVSGVSYGSGDVTPGAGSYATASGGAGVGGASGTAASTTAAAGSGAGGAGGASPAATNVIGAGSPNYMGVVAGVAQNTFANFLPVLMNATAGGPGANVSPNDDRSGAGSSGSVNGVGGALYGAGTFAGSGAVASVSDIGDPGAANKGGLYGGASGGVAVGFNSGTYTVAGTRAGLVLVEF